MHCCTITCSSCIIISSEAQVKKKQKPKRMVDEAAPRAREVQLSTCRSCRRSIGLVSLRDASIGVARLYHETVRNETVKLDCIVCGAPPFRNRICPHCGIILCSLCFDGWQQRCQESEQDMIPCVHCRQTCNADQYLHDRFIAKIAHGTCQRDQRNPKNRNAEVAGTPHANSSEISIYHICARTICGIAVFIFILILSCQARGLQQRLVCFWSKLGGRSNLQQLVSQQAGALQEWLADEGARSLIHCENEVPNRFNAIPWASFACAWAPGSQAIQEHWKLIRSELVEMAGCVRMQSMRTKEVLGALYAVEVRLVMQTPKAYEEFFDALLSIGGPLPVEEQNFQRVRKAVPHFSYAYLYLGLSFAKQGKLHQALTQTNRCLAQNPHNIECEILKFKLLKRLHMPIEGSLEHDRVMNCLHAMDDIESEANYTYMLRGYTMLFGDGVMTGWSNSRFAMARAAMHDA